MFCKNCGSELEEGALFCSACGTKNESEEEMTEQENDSPAQAEEPAVAPVEEAAPAEPAEASAKEEAVQAEPAAAAQSRFCPNCGCENDTSDIFCRECGMSLDAVAGNAGEKTAAVSSAGGKKWFIPAALGAGCLVILALAVWGITHLMSGGSDGEPFVLYDKENELTAARKNKFEPFLVGDRVHAQEDENGNGSGWAADYMIRYSENGEYLYYPQKYDESEFDLYRKNLNQKKDTGTKLVSKIRSYILIDNDRFVYLKDAEKNRLHLYYKGESEKIASEVDWYRVSEDKKYVIWTSDGDLRAQAVKAKAEQQKLDSDVTQVLAMSDDLKTIVYMKEDRLCIMKGMKDSERIDSDVRRAYVSDVGGSCKIYYLKSDDYYAAEEAPAAEEAAPAAENEEVFASDYFSYYDLLEDDLLAGDQNIKEPEWEDYEQAVYNDRDGVTYETDEAGYEAAWQLYEEKRSRNDLRRSLVNSPVDLTEWEVYYYEGNKGESSEVMTANLLSGAGVYGDLMEDEAVLVLCNVNTEQVETQKLSALADLDAWEIQSRLQEKLAENAELLYLRDGTINTVESVTESNDMQNVYANADRHILYLEYREDDRNAVYRFDYRAKNAAPELINDEVQYVVSADLEELCYLDEDGVLFYGDQEIDEDASFITVCDGGKLLYLVDADDENEGTLKLFTGGAKSTEIEENVLGNSYGLFDGEHAAFLTDYSYRRNQGDLGVFVGKKTQIVDTDVNRIYFPQRQ